MTTFEIGMVEATDPQLLDRAAREGRIVVTHDRRTMPAHATDLISSGKIIGGLFVVARSLPLQRAIEDLELLISCSENSEWVNVIRYLPF